MNRFQVFVIRVILGIAFSVFLIRFFYPDATFLHITGLAALLVGLAYVLELFRKKNTG